MAVNDQLGAGPKRRLVLGGLVPSASYTPAPSAEPAAWRKGSGFALCSGRALSFVLGLVCGRIERPRSGAAQKGSPVHHHFTIHPMIKRATPMSSCFAVSFFDFLGSWWYVVAVAVFVAVFGPKLVSRKDEP